MPPKRKHIVKSGNAGNSSKSTAPVPALTPTGEKPLFPAGFKTPMSILYERCQKNGWEKPNVSTKAVEGGFTFAINLARRQTASSDLETVYFKPRPPKVLPTANEAKHWGATYALYRFSNNLQLHRLLPPGPREYWTELSEEHKKAPEHQVWEYNPDPFAAKKEVEARQAVVIRKRRQREEEEDKPPSAIKEFELAPEVRMATSMREMVEDVIREMSSRYPGVISEELSSSAPVFPVREVEVPLRALGFQPHQIQRVVDFMSSSTKEPSPYLASLLALSPLDACLSWLLVHIPESDLPPQFFNQQATSDPFVRSVASGSSALAMRWLSDRATKESGWPPKVVAELIPLLNDQPDLGVLTERLDRRLIGLDAAADLPSIESTSDRDQRRTEEVEAIQAVYTDAQYDSDGGQGHILKIPLPSAPEIFLNVILSPSHPYPSSESRFPPMYVSSTKVPSYVRLHLLSHILKSLQPPDGDFYPLLEAGEGIIFSAVEHADAEYAVVREAPPEVNDVMKYLIPKASYNPALSRPSASYEPKKKARGTGNRNRDDRTHVQVKQDFEQMCQRVEYAKMLETRKKLPAWDSRNEIVRLADSSRVVVVVGETGCGKTTQLPQFILDSCIASAQGASANIVITQPRRVSALSVAARVSSERLDDGSVGYAIRGESKQTKRTKLLFCTTGVLLRRMTLGDGDGFEGITHVIVDEVHERSVDGDFLLLELRELLKRNATIKIILMSATINQQTFVDYFGGAPVLEIPGFTHPVKDIYVEDVISKIKYTAPSVRGAPKQTEEQLRALREEYESRGLDATAVRTIENLSRTDQIDYQLISAIVVHIVQTADTAEGALLIFLPGVQEIRQCMDSIRNSTIGYQVEVMPLHANLSSDEQRRVFLPTKKRKVVVATNVAETSITIPEVTFVIDSGKVKQIEYDPIAGLSRLVETWATLAAARQRRGRAGRTRPGQCYKIFTRRQERQMKAYPVPEILRVPLESLSLQIKVMREDEDVTLFLSRAIDPPKVEAMKKAWSTLEELGAVDYDGHLTALGRQMSLLPVDLRLGKMMILGAIFRCLDTTLTIAATLSSKPLFLSPVDKRDEANKARLRFATADSDLLTDAAAYNQFRDQRSQGSAAQRRFCEENFLSASTLRDISSLRGDFFSALADIGFVPLSAKPTDLALNTNGENTNLMKAIILGGLWPRVTRVSMPNATFTQVAAGTVQNDYVAKEFKIFDKQEGRVFLHPSSVLFGVSNYRSPFLAYFSMSVTSKTFLRDATQVPLYALLLFGGDVSVDHLKGGLTVGQRGWIKMRAWSRIGVLVNQLRRLLDAQLAESIESATIAEIGENNPVIQVMLELITRDGLSTS